MRDQARQIVSGERFLEMHASAPVEWCEANDTSGLYAKARKGEYKNFAGVDLNYETPDKPVLSLPTHEISVKEAVDRIMTLLRERRIFPAK
jgi:adenylylsulfate kinase-like enzyme